jgi:hypothetical protein
MDGRMMSEKNKAIRFEDGARKIIREFNTATGKFAEHDRVKSFNGETGTVVHVFPDKSGYMVEFTSPRHDVRAVREWELEDID